MFVSISRKCEFLSHFKSDYHDTTENEKEELLTTEKLPDRKLKKKNLWGDKATEEISSDL